MGDDSSVGCAMKESAHNRKLSDITTGISVAGCKQQYQLIWWAESLVGDVVSHECGTAIPVMQLLIVEAGRPQCRAHIFLGGRGHGDSLMPWVVAWRLSIMLDSKLSPPRRTR